MPRIAALAPFKVRSYRFQWPADLLTSWALEMEFLILGWYVLVETGSVLLLSLFGALQHGGTLIAPMVGVVSDRVGPRNLLVGMRLIHTSVAATLMIVAFADALTPAIVLALVGVTGLVRPSDLGLRAALIADTLPLRELPAAMGLSRITSDSARIAGALTGAGLFAVLGMGVSYTVIAAFYALGVILISQAGALQPAPSADRIVGAVAGGASVWRELRDGLSYIRNTPSLAAIMWLALLFNFTAFPITSGLLPYVAREIYHVDQTGLGYLIASFALGAVVASILMYRAGGRLARLMTVAGVAWHALLVWFAQIEGFALGAAVLAIAGFAQGLTMVSLTVILMRDAGQRFRGRVMGVRLLAIYSLPIGLLLAGALIEHIGFAVTATLYASTGLALTVVIAARWRVHMWPVREPGRTVSKEPDPCIRVSADNVSKSDPV
jgi:predicted MFS family arabinose efflux permease